MKNTVISSENGQAFRKYTKKLYLMSSESDEYSFTESSDKLLIKFFFLAVLPVQFDFLCAAMFHKN